MRLAIIDELKVMAVSQLVRRSLWFVALWGGGVLSLMAFAIPLRWLLKVV